MAKLNMRSLLFSIVTMVSLVACAPTSDERDEEPIEVDESTSREAIGNWGGSTPADSSNKASSCIPRIEASNWYCCGRFRECKAVYICEYCPNSKSCYRQGGLQERYSPGCY